jgi:flagellin
MTSGSVTTIHDTATGGTFVYTATASSTLASLATAVANAVSAGTLSAGTTQAYTGGHLVIATSTGSDSQQVSTNDAAIGNMNATVVANNSSTVYLGDGTSAGHQTVTTSIAALTTGAGGLGLGVTANALESTTNAASELALINTAISTIASDRGTIGANVNQLNAASAVINNQIQNLTSAESGINDANIGDTVANMSKYNTLSQTGISALQQANQASQAILKLLQ